MVEGFDSGYHAHPWSFRTTDFIAVRGFKWLQNSTYLPVSGSRLSNSTAGTGEKELSLLNACHTGTRMHAHAPALQGKRKLI